MITLADLTLMEWRNPWWLLLALQPWLIAAWKNLRRTRVAHYADAALQPWALRGAGLRTPLSWRRVINGMMWMLFAVAAAGPRIPMGTAESGPASAPFHGGNIMVVLDVSSNMATGDTASLHLQRAQLELQDLLARLRGERVGLIAFASGAGLLSPLTNDYAAFAYYLALADASLFKTPGKNYTAALDLALHALPQAGASSRSVLLITDGDALSGEAGVAALAAAQRLKQANVALYILAVGARDRAALQLLANAADGKLELISDGDGDWRALYDRGLLTLPGEPPPPAFAQRWQELYPGFLFAALVLLLAPTLRSRGHAVTALMIAMAFMLGGQSAPAWAAEADAAHAWRAYRDGAFAQAQLLFGELTGFDARMGEGAAAYRRKHYSAAIEQFTSALIEASSVAQRADALFNLGNSHFQSGNFRAAADAYADVVRLRPGEPNAQSNLDLTTARLKQARQADPNAVGVLGRRGSQTGGVLGEEIGDRPVTIESSDEPEKKVGAGTSSPGAERATPQDAGKDKIDTAWRLDDADRLHRAAQKKLELIKDRPADMLGEILMRDTPQTSLPP